MKDAETVLLQEVQQGCLSSKVPDLRHDKFTLFWSLEETQFVAHTVFHYAR